MLKSLAALDELARLLRELPGTQPGTSRDRLQQAMAARAQLFVAEKLVMLKSLGFEDLAPTRVKPGRRAALAAQTGVVGDAARAGRLAVLLECVASRRDSSSTAMISSLEQAARAGPRLPRRRLRQATTRGRRRAQGLAG